MTQPSDLHPSAVAGLADLLAGLDRLDPILALPESPVTADPGVRLGRYVLRARLGAGRFGVVLLADDPTLGRLVAVKVPQPVVLTDPGLRARFVREALAAARLDHPGVVPVFEAGEDGPLPYLATGHVAGPSLAGWLRDHPGPVPPAAAAAVISRAAVAVQHAHERAVLHCDLSPSNVLLQPRSAGGTPTLTEFTPVVTDFGLARLMEGDPSLTRTFQVAGTPAYMSPEQARGDRRNLTARSDVYSLGAILYELLTGRPPDVGPVGMHVPSPRQVNPSVPTDLSAVCMKCLEPDPAHRYPSAGELGADLGRFLGGLPVTARPLGSVTRVVRWARRSPGTAAALVAMVVVSAALCVVAGDRWVREQRARADARASEATADAARFVAGLERVRQRRLVGTPGWAGANRTDIAELARSPAAADAAGLLRTEAVAVLGTVSLGEPRVVADGFRAYAPAFSPDGRYVALGSWFPPNAGKCEVRVLDADTGIVDRTLTYPTDTEWEARNGNPDSDGCRRLVYSPDGRWLVVGTRSGWLVRWDLFERPSRPVRWRLAGDDWPVRWSHPTGLEFTPGGRVLVASGFGGVFGWDVSAGWREAFRAAPADPRPIPIPVSRPPKPGVPVFAALDGRLLMVVEDPPGLAPDIPMPEYFHLAGPAAGMFALAQGVDLREVGHAPGDDRDPQTTAYALPESTRAETGPLTDLVLSPDGALLVAAAEHNERVRVWDTLSGRNVFVRGVPPRDGVEGSLRLAFRPDGRELAVAADNRTLVFPVLRPAVVSPCALGPFPLDDAAATPDGGTLATRGRPRGGTEAALSVWSAGPPHRLLWRRLEPPVSLPGTKRLVALSPDARLIGFTAWESAYYRSLDGSGPTSTIVPGCRDMLVESDGGAWAATAAGLVRRSSDLRGEVAPPPIGPAALCLAPAGVGVFVGRDDGTVALCGADGTPEKVLQVSRSGVRAVAARSNGETFLAGDGAGGIRVSRVTDGVTIWADPAGHSEEVTAAAAGPGGWFATGGADREVRVWNPQGRLAFSIPQSRPVGRLFWAADGRTLTVLAEGERGLRRWHLDHLKAELAGLGLDPGLP